jgi:hypothetical protein
MRTHVVSVERAEFGESGKSPLPLQSYAIGGSHRHLQNKEINTSNQFFFKVVSLSLLAFNTMGHYHKKGQVVLLWWLSFVNDGSAKRVMKWCVAFSFTIN